MSTLKLARKQAQAPARKSGRTPVRGVAAARKRPTLAQAQAERAEKAETLSAERAARKETSPARPARREAPDRPPRGPRRNDATDRPRPAAQRRDPGDRPAPTDRPPRAARRPDDAQRGPRPPRRDERPDLPRSAGPRPAPRAAPPGAVDPAPRKPPARPRRPPGDAPPPAQTPSEEGDRLSKRMTALGMASRREADEWIEAGWVRVDGRVAVLGQRVRPDASIVVDPAARGQQAQRVTILLNKPVGYVSGQAEDGYENAATLIRPDNQWSGDRSGTKFQRGHLRSLAPAGRLDIDSVGLLVLTQDGRIAKLLVGDEGRVEKEYLVRVAPTGAVPLSMIDLRLLQQGMELDGEPLKPAKVSWQNEDQLRFVLREGKKRQIRRMCEEVGLKVLGLKRVRIGSVVLGPLPVGQWRYLRADERFV